MKVEFERRLLEIVNDQEIAQQVLELIEQEQMERKAAFVRRQAEGIAAARSRGVALGRPKQPLSPEIAYFYWAVFRGELSLASAAREMGVTRGKMDYQLRRYARENKLPRPGAERSPWRNRADKTGGAAEPEQQNIG